MEVTDGAYPLADLELARRLERTEGMTSARFVGTKARVNPASGAARAGARSRCSTGRSRR